MRPYGIPTAETPTAVNAAVSHCTSLTPAVVVATVVEVPVTIPAVVSCANVSCVACAPHELVATYDAQSLLVASAEKMTPPTPGYCDVGTHTPRGEYVTLVKLDAAPAMSAP